MNSLRQMVKRNAKQGSTALLFMLVAIAVTAVLGLVYVWWRFPYYRTTSVAMSPNVNPGDLFLVDRFAYDDGRRPNVGDVVTFVAPTFSSAPGAPNTPGMKRVVAVAGDSVMMQGGVLRRNGAPVSEPRLGSRAPYRLEIRDFALYVDGRRPAGVFMPPAARWSGPDRVPTGCYLMLGDNRAHSVDSHIIGFVCPGLPTTVDGVVPSIVGRVLMPPLWHVK